MQQYQATTSEKPRLRAIVVAESPERARELLEARFPQTPSDHWEIEIVPQLKEEGVKEWTIL
ncbi:hypothetical protein [Stenotrophomonas phage YB07]|uniref:Uncharacterized protein n=1 Tax=Stenotrophomonas phage YB07 TaxID=2555548 RepID=A0A482IHT4_9CAUD|nr:hypothetical protein HWC11_gp249 [Stenotrophomonas phage YB07]QBP06445.1 hypothetical protein [Stenotrophomonas phage YB07]